MVMIKNKAAKGIVTYKLHPEFLAQLTIKSWPRKFQKVQYWHLIRDNILLVTAEEREAEYCTQMSALALSWKRKYNEDAWQSARKEKKSPPTCPLPIISYILERDYHIVENQLVGDILNMRF